MTDYNRLISRGVAGLASNREEARRALYDRARAALLGRLDALDPPLDAIGRTRERLALEEAFRRVEAAVEAAADLGLSFAEFDHHAQIADALGGLADRLVQQAHGANVALDPQGTLLLAATDEAADQEVAADPLIRHVYGQVAAKGSVLERCVSELSRRGRWAGLVRAVELIGALLAQPAAETAARIGILWSLTVSLRAYVERSEDARYSARDGEDPLDPEILSLVKDFVLAAGPWVRRFPGGRRLDSDVASWTDQQDDMAPTTALLGRLERAGLFGGKNAIVVTIALDVAHGESVPALRARAWANATIRNLGLVLVQALVALSRARTGAPGAAFRPGPKAARAIEETVAAGREELAALLAGLPGGEAAPEALQRMDAAT